MIGIIIAIACQSIDFKQQVYYHPFFKIENTLSVEVRSTYFDYFTLFRNSEMIFRACKDYFSTRK